MKTLVAILIVFLTVNVKAQTPFEQLVNAERSFEKACLDSGIKRGFLANLDSTAIAFTQNGIQKAKKFWQSLPDFPGIYSWAPSFAEVSLSGEWGYTTGAVEYRDSSLDDTPSSYNQYTTVWHKNKEGEWKYLVDIGNTHGPVKIDSTAKEIKVKKVAIRNLNNQVILNQEKLFASQFKINANEAIKKYYSKTFILNFSGHALTTELDTAIALFVPSAAKINYEPFDVKLSPSGDMAVVYGFVMPNNLRKTYVRIWRREPAGWKIALEVTKP